MHAADELRRAFEAAGSVFCVAARQMTAALRRISKNHYWGMFRNFLWYRWSAVVEGVHAMMAGFLRHKHYASRQPSSPPMSRMEHILREVWRFVWYISLGFREFFLLQQVYFASCFLGSLATEKIPGKCGSGDGARKFASTLRFRAYLASHQKSPINSRIGEANLTTFTRLANRAFSCSRFLSSQACHTRSSSGVF